MGKLTESELRELGEIYNTGVKAYSSENSEKKMSNEERQIYLDHIEPRGDIATPYAPRNPLGVLRLSSGAAREEGLSTDLGTVEDLESKF